MREDRVCGLLLFWRGLPETDRRSEGGHTNESRKLESFEIRYCREGSCDRGSPSREGFLQYMTDVTQNLHQLKSVDTHNIRSYLKFQKIVFPSKNRRVTDGLTFYVWFMSFLTTNPFIYSLVISLLSCNKYRECFVKGIYTRVNYVGQSIHLT